MLDALNIALMIAMGTVFLVLCAGIYAMFRGGSFGRSWSNRLMRLRVLVQFIAVLLIVAGFWLKSTLTG